MQLNLKAARANKGYTQKEAARLIGVNQGTLSNYERGKTYPKVPILERISLVYGIDYNELIFLQS